ncbi:hypothetical protein HMI55_003562 [Coelomomyces lativittatus]|nr:hypothetical protein HMI55_003562 [Coelomomyces lativittatus]
MLDPNPDRRATLHEIQHAAWLHPSAHGSLDRIMTTTTTTTTTTSTSTHSASVLHDGLKEKKDTHDDDHEDDDNDENPVPGGTFSSPSSSFSSSSSSSSTSVFLDTLVAEITDHHRWFTRAHMQEVFRTRQPSPGYATLQLMMHRHRATVASPTTTTTTMAMERHALSITSFLSIPHLDVENYEVEEEGVDNEHGEPSSLDDWGVGGADRRATLHEIQHAAWLHPSAHGSLDRIMTTTTTTTTTTSTSTHSASVLHDGLKEKKDTHDDDHEDDDNDENPVPGGTFSSPSSSFSSSSSSSSTSVFLDTLVAEITDHHRWFTRAHMQEVFRTRQPSPGYATLQLMMHRHRATVASPTTTTTTMAMERHALSITSFLSIPHLDVENYEVEEEGVDNEHGEPSSLDDWGVGGADRRATLHEIQHAAWLHPSAHGSLDRIMTTTTTTTTTTSTSTHSASVLHDGLKEKKDTHDDDHEDDDNDENPVPGGTFSSPSSSFSSSSSSSSTSVFLDTLVAEITDHHRWFTRAHMQEVFRTRQPSPGYATLQLMMHRHRATVASPTTTTTTMAMERHALSITSAVVFG